MEIAVIHKGYAVFINYSFLGIAAQEPQSVKVADNALYSQVFVIDLIRAFVPRIPAVVWGIVIFIYVGCNRLDILDLLRK